MKKSDFSYDLPPELIAQSPLEARDSSRLLRLNKETGDISHHHFFDIVNLLNPGDCLVLNDSRVIPARLFGRRQSGGAVEVVLLKDRGDKVWECLTRPGKKAKPGTKLSFGDGALHGEVEAEVEGGNRLIRFTYDGIFLNVLERLGRMPLPPYIHEELADADRYQTVYSKVSGSAAAPTAGLHFTDGLLGKLADRGVITAFVTLHVGLGTFRPVKADDIEDHEMHAEYCEIAAETALAVNLAKREGRRVIAVGTTSCRTLESQADNNGCIRPFCGYTNAFIYPGYHFKCVDGLITNFHLPESTLLMLVSALAGREQTLAAYSDAIVQRYRFFSFGDAMFVE